MSKSDFRKQTYERKKQQDKQNKDQARAWYKEGHTPAFIAAWLGVPESVVRCVYLKGVIKDESKTN